VSAPARLPRQRCKNRPELPLNALLAVLLGAAMLAAILTGPYAVAPCQALAILLGRIGLAAELPAGDPQAAVLLGIRLPRVLLAALAGAGLGLAGTVLQGLFRNPLADPGLLGVASGAATGAAIAIVALPPQFAGPWLLGELAVPLSAFGGSLLATVAVYRLSLRDGRASLGVMLLAGIAVNALAGAAIGFLSSVSSDEQLRNLTFWNLGSLGRADWPMLATLAGLVLPAAALMLGLAAPLNVLLLGESEARHLGVELDSLKRRGIALSALIVGALVSACGMIGFISLIAPHLVRLAAGPDHRRVMPGSALAGATLLVASDTVARTVAAPAEIPIGIVTALLGAPFFLWLLRHRWSEGTPP
jgi:iron complex transport system permease protein